MPFIQTFTHTQKLNYALFDWGPKPRQVELIIMVFSLHLALPLPWFLCCVIFTVLVHVAFQFCGACFSRYNWRSLSLNRLAAQWSLFELVDASDWRSLNRLPSEVSLDWFPVAVALHAACFLLPFFAFVFLLVVRLFFFQLECLNLE